MKHIDLSLILPCYNEVEHFNKSMERIVDSLKNSNLHWEVIFVEDKSQDQTPKLIKSFLEKHKGSFFHSIWHSQNQGRGRSVADGILAARGEFVGFIDIDCEASPVYISECVRLLQEYDVVCGKRIYQTDISGIVRAIASKLYANLVKFILNSNCQDTEAGYKFFRRTKIIPILKTVEDTGWFWDTEIMVRSEVANLRIKSFSILFERRKDKTSTVHLIKDTLDYISKLWKFRLTVQKLRS